MLSLLPTNFATNLRICQAILYQALLSTSNTSTGFCRGPLRIRKQHSNTLGLPKTLQLEQRLQALCSRLKTSKTSCINGKQEQQTDIKLSPNKSPQLNPSLAPWPNPRPTRGLIRRRSSQPTASALLRRLSALVGRSLSGQQFNRSQFSTRCLSRPWTCLASIRVPVSTLERASLHFCKT